jgi:uncharacterized membrane protein YagU involved in acid resistance
MAQNTTRDPSSERQTSIGYLLIGVAAGLVGNVVAGRVNEVLSQYVSEDQKRREKEVREAPPHETAGPRIAQKISGKDLSEQAWKRAQMAFTLAYGAGFGLLYAVARRRMAWTARLVGLPFGVAFFGFCDGLMAVRLGLTPPPHRLPWQPNLKELGNHLTWTASAEAVHRVAERVTAWR